MSVNVEGLPEGVQLARFGVKKGDHTISSAGQIIQAETELPLGAVVVPAPGYKFDEGKALKIRRKIVTVTFDAPEDYGSVVQLGYLSVDKQNSNFIMYKSGMLNVQERISE